MWLTSHLEWPSWHGNLSYQATSESLYTTRIQMVFSKHGASSSKGINAKLPTMSTYCTFMAQCGRVNCEFILI